MSNWRARRYIVKLNRRHRVHITVRRFRLAKKVSSTPRRKQLIVNLHLGRIRQISLEYRQFGRRKAARDYHRLQMALASLLIFCGLCGITLSAAALAKPASLPATNTFKAAAPVVAKPLTLPKSTPTHITIASQEIDVDLVPVGLAADGSIEVPPPLEWVAGWYNQSPTPGELGPAVIVGHVDNYEGISVFWRLRDVKAGDMIDVAREDGTVAHFQVTQLAEYDQNNFPTQLVYGNTAGSELRVITCSGTFDTATQHYTRNTVLYAKLLS